MSPPAAMAWSLWHGAVAHGAHGAVVVDKHYEATGSPFPHHDARFLQIEEEALQRENEDLSAADFNL